MPPGITDTAVMLVVMRGVFRELGASMPASTLAPARHPWEVSFPSGAVWSAARDHVLRALRAHEPSPQDSVKSFVSIEEVSMRGDTLIANVQIGYKFRCRQGWFVTSTGYEATSVRHGTSWEGTTTKAILHVDSFGCPEDFEIQGSDVFRVEQIAIRAALDSSRGPHFSQPRITINPAIVLGGHAPGGTVVSRRDRRRSEFLAFEVKGKVLPRDSVVRCQNRQCELRDTDLYVTLSEPAISGNDAVISVTTDWVARRGLPYETLEIHLRRENGTWRVTRVVQLGIS
jgi:hypothetical protein